MRVKIGMKKKKVGNIYTKLDVDFINENNIYIS